MTLELTEQERVFLQELLAAKTTAIQHELQHTDLREYRDYVKMKMVVLEGLKSKVEKG